MDRNPLKITLKEVESIVQKDAQGEYLICPFCEGRVPLNGPGSDQTFIARFTKSFLNIFTPESQRIAWPASRLHDFQGHVGLAGENENRESAKQYRKNAFADLHGKYIPKIKSLRERKRNASGFWKWLKKLGYQKQINYLKKRVKKIEFVLEKHYDVLVEYGPEYMVKEPCWEHLEKTGMHRK